MRCYHFTNMYLSSIQQGIQSAHSQMEMFVKYEDTSSQKDVLYDWASNHKTMVILNGGYLSVVQELLEFLTDDNNPYPFAPFYESPEALGGILTCIGLVLPEKIYVGAKLMRDKIIDKNAQVIDTDLLVEYGDYNYGIYSEFELALCQRLNQYRLAS